MAKGRAPVQIFIAYAEKDKELLGELETHLAVLKRNEVIAIWYHEQVIPGAIYSEAINKQLQQASIILLLVSSDFLSSEYYDLIDLERYDIRLTQVLPIIIRSCRWEDASFAKLQHLPLNGKAITEWDNKDTAWKEVVEGIRQAIGNVIQEIVPDSRPLQLDTPHTSKPQKPKWLSHRFKLLALLLIISIMTVFGGGFWLRIAYNQASSTSLHVVVGLTDCDDLLARSQQLSRSSTPSLTDELSQINQRLQSCTLPTGTWTINTSGFRGTFLIKLDYRGTFQDVFQLTNEPAYYLKGYWNSTDQQITFTRSSANGKETQKYVGTLTLSDPGYDLIGTFSDNVSSQELYNWSATINKNPDSQGF